MDWLTMSLLSQHLSNQPWMNENNPGLGLEKQLSTDTKGIAGFYKNTEGRNSIYGGINYSPVEVGPFKLGANLGLLSGYKVAPVVPMVAPTLSYEKNGLGANVVFMPNPKDWKTSAIGLQIKKAIEKPEQKGLLDFNIRRAP